MKKTIFIILLALFCNLSFAQNFSELDNAKFDSAESYKTAEKQVLSCANYLFDNPIDKEELNRLKSIQYIMKWMSGTADYTFDLGQKAMELTNGNSDLVGLYMAAMSKVVLENNNQKWSSDELYNEAEKILVKYCANSENKIKPSKKIKKLLKETM